KYASQMMGVWFLAVTAGDSVTGLMSNPAVGGVDLSGSAAVAVQAALAALAGVAVFMYRRKPNSRTGDVHCRHPRDAAGGGPRPPAGAWTSAGPPRSPCRRPSRHSRAWRSSCTAAT